MLLYTRRINLALIKPSLGNGHRSGLIEKRRLAQRTLAADLSVHGKAAPSAHRWGVAPLARLEQLDHGVRRQALVVVVVHLDHRRVGAGPEALHLEEGEESVLGRFAVLDAQVVGDSLFDVLRTADHARRRAAQLDVELALRLAVVHGEEGGDLVHVHVRAPQPLRDLVHRRQRHLLGVRAGGQGCGQKAWQLGWGLGAGLGPNPGGQVQGQGEAQGWGQGPGCAHGHTARVRVRGREG